MESSIFINYMRSFITLGVSGVFIYFILSFLEKKTVKIKITVMTQSGPQDQKNVIFSHNVMNLNQLLKNSKNTEIFS